MRRITDEKTKLRNGRQIGWKNRNREVCDVRKFRSKYSSSNYPKVTHKHSTTLHGSERVRWFAVAVLMLRFFATSPEDLCESLNR